VRPLAALLCIGVGLVLAAVMTAAAPADEGRDLPAPAPTDHLYLAPHDAELPPDVALRIHDYGSAALVHLDDPGRLDSRLASRLHRLPDTAMVAFRSWHGQLPAATAADLIAGRPGFYLVSLVGPPDSSWRGYLEELGMRVVATGFPFVLLVEADGAALARALELSTSQGYRVVAGVVPVPVEARASRDLLEAAASKRRALPIAVKAWRFGRGSRGEPPRPISLELAPGELYSLLAASPGIGYVQPVYGIEPHANLAAQSHLLDVEAVWSDLGCNGSGVTIAHNDTGVDLTHPDLPRNAIVATSGRMAYTDTWHGTHTAGALIGRGSDPSPVNTWDCGDQTPPLPVVRGMAWGATLATNNIFDGGLGDVAEMMQWAAAEGAAVSSNSWGLTGAPSVVVMYTAESVAVDRAVRDADPATAEHEEMTVLFSAGNLGPAASTVTAPGTAKNAITVGASQNDRCGTWVPGHDPGPDLAAVLSSSSRGPSQGRIKPDLVAPGSDVLAAESADMEAANPWDQGWTGGRYALATGTSQACALAAGAAAVFHELYWRSFAARPSPALVRAALVNGALDLGSDVPSAAQGWGRLDLDRAAHGPLGGAATFFDQGTVEPLTTGARWSDEIEVFSAATPLKITLAWTDPPGEEDSDHPLRNDLDLAVTAPDGTVYRGNRLTAGWSTPDPGADGDRDNNLENVFVASPFAGSWSVEVTAVSVLEPPPGLAGQDFALVYSGDAAACRAPEPPSGVAAAAAGDNRIDVWWDPVPGAFAYQVSRATQAGGRPYLELATIEPPQSLFADTSVAGGITYFYVVRVLIDCWSASSAEASATATGACLEAPLFTGLGTVADSHGVSCGLDLEWEPATSPCGREPIYTVYRGTSPDFVPGPDTVVASGLAETQWRDLGLVTGQECFYLVRAVDPASGVEDANVAVRSGAPSGPDQVWLEDDGELGDGMWSRRRGSSADTVTEPWQLTTVDALSPPRSWYCRDEGRVKDQVLALRTPLELPAGTPAVLEFWHRFVLDQGWDGGRLEYSVDGGADWHDILDGDGFSVPADDTRFLDGSYPGTLAGGSSLNPLAGEPAWSGDSRGWLRVRVDLADLIGQPLLLRWRLACDQESSLDRGWWVDDIRIVRELDCQQCLAPAAPVGVTAAPQGGGVAVGWSPVAAATAYRVLRSTRAGGPHEAVATVQPPTTTWFDGEVSGGTVYHYVVTVHTDCWSAPSAEASAAAPGACTLAPLFYGIAAVSSPRSVLCVLEPSWAPARPRCPGESVGYRVFRSETAGFTPGPATLVAEGVTHSAWHDHDVEPGRTYHYAVRAVDDVNGAEDGNVRTLPGSPLGPGLTLLEDDVEDATTYWLALTGSSADSGTQPWIVVSDGGHSGARSWFCADEPVVKDQVLALAEPLPVPASARPTLELWHAYSLDLLWDGGRLEYSVNGGATWHDILDGDGGGIPANSGRFLAGGYSGVLLDLPADNPLAGEATWTGASDHWERVEVDLVDFAGQSLLLRWRLGCNSANAFIGWWMDDVRVSFETPCDGPPRDGGARLH